MSGEEFAELFDALSTWGRWGEGDERGSLHHSSAATVVAAAALVRDGRTFGLGRRLDTRASAHNPKPADHEMTMLGDGDGESGSLGFMMDYVGLDYHHASHSHIDALCHVSYGGSLYNGFKTVSTVSADGAEALSVETLKEGLVGRGVLLDVPGVRDRSWLEPGESVFRDDLEAAEQSQGVRVGAGDILLVRTGYAQRLAELGDTTGSESVAGLHPTAMTFVADRRVAALGSDGNSDTAPSTTQGVAFPIHVLAINAMGVHLLDYLSFEDMREACASAGRWDFLFVAAPLQIGGGTGSPVNPIAIL
ncbi:MAG: cyclase family protein [Mycetocola sp.]